MDPTDHTWASEEEKREQFERELDEGIDTDDDYLTDVEIITGPPRTHAVITPDPCD